VIRGECRNHPTTSAVLVCKFRPLQIHPQGHPPVSVGSSIRRASGAVCATMTTLLYPSSRLPATSDRCQASLGGLHRPYFAYHPKPVLSRPEVAAIRMKIRASFKQAIYLVTVWLELDMGDTNPVKNVKRVLKAACQDTAGDYCQG
jgi:hypothetical protein